MPTIVFLIAHLGGGGAERVTVSLANYFSRKGYKVHLIIFSDKYNEYVIDEGITKYVLPRHQNKVVDVLKKVSRLRQLLKNINPKYVCSLGFSYRYLFLGNLMNKYRFILSERNAPKYQYPQKIDLEIVKYCLNRAYHIVFQTEEAKSFFSDTIQSKSTIIPNPIKEGLPKPYVGEREKRIVAYSRLSEQKNIPLLLRSAKTFFESFPEYILEICGRGECEDELKEYSKTLGIDDKVFFMGFTKDIHSQILKAKMFVSSSDYEGISNSMLESMAIGLPCVCTDCPVGGARMFIKTGENGILVPVRDEKALTDAMVQITTDEFLEQKLSQNASFIREQLTVESICRKWEEVL
jgi:GalNAc-alpha-(1->4)-GalNAc-alpha-(1->3)-diNAcBac-PP-undecaprenol alpha-1,4-N-acetyl-D-galactosaminyltransferase